LTRDYVDDRKPDTLQASFHSEFCYGPKTLPPQGDPVIPLTPIRNHNIATPVWAGTRPQWYSNSHQGWRRISDQTVPSWLSGLISVSP